MINSGKIGDFSVKYVMISVRNFRSNIFYMQFLFVDAENANDEIFY